MLGGRDAQGKMKAGRSRRRSGSAGLRAAPRRSGWEPARAAVVVQEACISPRGSWILGNEHSAVLKGSRNNIDATSARPTSSTNCRCSSGTRAQLPFQDFYISVVGILRRLPRRCQTSILLLRGHISLLGKSDKRNNFILTETCKCGLRRKWAGDWSPSGKNC